MMRNQIYNTLALFLLLFGLVSCEDDRLYNPGEIGEGEATISADVTFRPLASALQSRATGGTPGDAIKTISDLNIIVYTEAGKFVGIYPISDSAITWSDNKEMPGDATTDEKDSTLDEYGHQAEKETKKAEFKLKDIAYGRYHMYAVANVAPEYLAEDNIKDETKLKEISIKWKEENVSSNNEMFGYFTPENEKKSDGFGPVTITVDRPNIKIHSWVKRLA